jgi:hypothetical protein
LPKNWRFRLNSRKAFFSWETFLHIFCLC